MFLCGVNIYHVFKIKKKEKSSPVPNTQNTLTSNTQRVKGYSHLNIPRYQNKLRKIININEVSCKWNCLHGTTAFDNLLKSMLIVEVVESTSILYCSIYF